MQDVKCLEELVLFFCEHIMYAHDMFQPNNLRPTIGSVAIKLFKKLIDCEITGIQD